MHFDQSNATLLISPDELHNLIQASTDKPSTDKPSTDPTVHGIAQVLGQPARWVILERFDGQQVDISFVAWDQFGRATITNGLGDGQLAIIGTQLDLLPALLSQAVRLHSQSVPGSRPAILTVAAKVEEALTGATFPAEHSSKTGDSAGVHEAPKSDLQIVLKALRHGWRVTGSWSSEDADCSLTVLDAGDEGLWLVEHDAMEPGSQSSPDTVVQLTPTNSTEVRHRMGDVVTGRTADVVTGGMNQI